MRDGEIQHKFYLGQKVKVFTEGKELIGRILEIKIKSEGYLKKNQITPVKKVSYRVEGCISNFLEQEIYEA